MIVRDASAMGPIVTPIYIYIAHLLYVTCHLSPTSIAHVNQSSSSQLNGAHAPFFRRHCSLDEKSYWIEP